MPGGAAGRKEQAGQISSGRPPWPWGSTTVGRLLTARVAGQCKDVV